MSAWDDLCMASAQFRAQRNGTSVKQELADIQSHEACQNAVIADVQSPVAAIPTPAREAKIDAPRRNNGQRKHLMDYIPPQRDGKNPLYAAVLFARELMRDGQRPDYANGWAARKYRVKKSDVAHYTGQVAGTVSGRRRVPCPC